MPANTILDVALSNPDLNGDGNGDFNILGTALGLFPDLVDAAGNPAADLTVFAPTDQAFLNLANVIDPSVGTDETAAVATLASASALLSPQDAPTSFLRTVLTYHIVGESLTGAEVVGSSTINTLSGDSIHPDGLTLGDADNDFADPVVTNPAGAANGIETDNGIIHVIDNVLLPYDITFADGGFLFTGSGQDAVIGSGNRDYIFLGSGDDIANGLDGNDQIYAGSGHDLLIGGNGIDVLAGGRGADTLEGGNDRDYLFGGKGRDDLDGGSGNDILYGGLGKDTLDGGEGHDRLYGGSNWDEMNGGTGDDYLSGGRGRDTLTGAEGDDFLRGGSGGDSFVFNPFRADEGHDVVADFNPVNDTLVLDLTTADPAVLEAIAAEGAAGLQFTDFLTFDTDPTTAGIQAAVTLGASADGDLLIIHPTGTIELNHIPSTVNPADLLPAIEFLMPDDWMVA